MKNYILTLVTAWFLTSLYAQQDTTDYSVLQGPVESVECKCEQGRFKQKTKELKYSGYTGIQCTAGYTEKYDKEGNLIETLQKNYSIYYNGVPVDGYTSFYRYNYENNQKVSNEHWIINSDGDSADYSKTFYYQLSDNVSADSTFDGDGQLMHVSSSEPQCDSLTGCCVNAIKSDNFSIYDSICYDAQDRIILNAYHMTFDEVEMSGTTYYTYIDNSTEIKTMKDGKLISLKLYVRNDSGLVKHEFNNYIEENAFEKNIDYSYKYEYDEFGNWVVKWIYSSGKLVAVERRVITYHRQ